MTPERIELLTAIRNKLLPSLALQADCFRKTIVPGLASHGIYLRQVAHYDRLVEI